MGRAGGGGGGFSGGGFSGGGHFGGGFSGGGSHRGGGSSFGGGGSSFGGGGSFRSGGSHSGWGGGSDYRGPIFVGGGGGVGGPRRKGGIFRRILRTIIIVAIIAIAAYAYSDDSSSSSSSSSSITHSTVEREKLNLPGINDGRYYTDELNWIRDNRSLENGMRNFYNETGVMPYLYLTDNVNGDTTPSNDQLSAYSEQLYDQLFSDEGHFLLLFVESEDLERTGDNYVGWYTVGNQARQVMDDEACQILVDHLRAYYENDELSDEQFFGDVFNDAGEKIMTVYKSPWPKVAAVAATAAGVVIVVCVANSMHKRKVKRDKEKAEETERILNTPLEKFGTSEADDLASKYEEDIPKPQTATFGGGAAAYATGGPENNTSSNQTTADYNYEQSNDSTYSYEPAQDFSYEPATDDTTPTEYSSYTGAAGTAQCPDCGGEVNAGTKFCPSCGADLRGRI